MCRKLTLTGWVLLIRGDAEQARVLLALLFSIAFLALQLSVQPIKWVYDRALMLSIELALLLIYTCVLVVKVCDMSSSVCATFGFGGDAKGIVRCRGSNRGYPIQRVPSRPVFRTPRGSTCSSSFLDL